MITVREPIKQDDCIYLYVCVIAASHVKLFAACKFNIKDYLLRAGIATLALRNTILFH